MNCLDPVFQLDFSKGIQKVHREITKLVSAGCNWHLFETIDIVKYGKQ